MNIKGSGPRTRLEHKVAGYRECLAKSNTISRNALSNSVHVYKHNTKLKEQNFATKQQADNTGPLGRGRALQVCTVHACSCLPSRAQLHRDMEGQLILNDDEKIKVCQIKRN